MLTLGQAMGKIGCLELGRSTASRHRPAQPIGLGAGA